MVSNIQQVSRTGSYHASLFYVLLKDIQSISFHHLYKVNLSSSAYLFGLLLSDLLQQNGSQISSQTNDN